MQITSPLGNWSLLNRLVLGVVMLSTLGFIASDIAAQSALRSYLTNQIDDQLLSVAAGSLLRLDLGGIAEDLDEDDLDEYKTFEKGQGSGVTRPVAPLQSVPTSTSVTLLDKDGEIVGSIGGDLNSAPITDYVANFPFPQNTREKNQGFTIEAPGHDFRVVIEKLPSQLGSVVVAQSLKDVDKTLNRLQTLFLLIGLFVIFLIAIASRKVIKIGLRPLESVESTAKKIAGGDLSARLPDANPTTEVGRLVTTLNTMLTRIEESFAARTESENKLRRFVADASHELRTPITAIRGFAELHRQGAVSGEVGTKELIGRIEGESLRMGSLVEDLLLLARIDQSREMKSEPVEMNKLVSDAVASAAAAGPQHPIFFTPASEEIYTLGDSQRIHQVVANLLANARAHTPSGTKIIVAISHEDDGVRISVEDFGPGLSEDHQKRIFERFYRADPSRHRTDSEGSGLGLSIVDAVMRAHGGSVTVRSEFGKGSTFTLFFPEGKDLTP
jgi:two-component system OmpR family sensor kinase